MGLLKNLVNAKVSGNVGSMNFRKRGSQTVVAERSYSNSSKGEGASLPQRMHRSRLANIVNFYRVIAAIEARAWQNKPENTSDFNMLSKYNLAASPIFLTKQEAQGRASVVAPYEVSRGSLTSLVQNFGVEGFNTGIKADAAFDVQTTTLGELSAKIIDLQGDWQHGDKLSIALCNHAMKEVAGVNLPQASVQYVEITLDTTSDTLLKDIPNVILCGMGFDDEGFIVCDATCVGAFAIHSRKVNGILETSSQTIILKDTADAIYTKYTGADQMQAAIDSYGYQSDVLLTPGEVQPAASEQVVDKFTWNGVTYTAPRTDDAAAANMQYNISIEGKYLGAVSVTGGTLVSTGGNATVRTAVVLTPTASTAYTVKVGDLVIISGTTAGA